MTNRKVRQEIFRKFWSQLIKRSISKTQMFANCSATTDHWISIDMGQSGLNLRLSVTEDRSRVECYIRFKEGNENTTAVYRALFTQRDSIESVFGEHLCWENLPNQVGCRISKDLDGGWKTRDEDWILLQDRILDYAYKLNATLPFSYWFLHGPQLKSWTLK